MLGHWCLPHTCCCIYSMCTTVQQRVHIPQCNVGPKTGSCAEDTKHMADCGKNTQGTRDTTNHVSVRCCRQTVPFRDKILQTDSFRDKMFITFTLIGLLWFETCQNLVTRTNCAAESKEKSTIVKIHVLPQLVRVCVKSSHCSLWSQFTRVSFIHLIMTFPSTH